VEYRVEVEGSNADVNGSEEGCDLSASKSLRFDRSVLTGDCAGVDATEAELLSEGGRTDVLHRGHSSETRNHSFKQSAW